MVVALISFNAFLMMA